MKGIRYILFLMLFLACNKPSQEKSPNVVVESNDPVILELSKAIELDNDNAENYYLRADRFIQQEAYASAIDDLEKAVSIDSSKASYFHLLADAYLDYYRSGEALDIMEKAAEKFPNRIPTLLKLSELQLILKQYDASFFTVQKILNLDNQNAEAFFMMGMIYRSQGDLERAINSFQTAVETDPEIIDAWIILGDLFAEKKMSIADQYYDNAIRLDPENMQAYHAKAFYLQNSNKVKEAINLYKEINAKDPQYADAYLNTGILYLEMDSVQQALEHFDILVKIEPQMALAYYYRGIAKLFIGNSNMAKSDLEQALQLDPTLKKAEEALVEINTL